MLFIEITLAAVRCRAPAATSYNRHLGEGLRPHLWQSGMNSRRKSSNRLGHGDPENADTATVRERRALLSALAAGALCSAPWSQALAQGASIVAPLLDGSTFSTEHVKGRVLLVNFWATWCAPSVAEMPEIEAYYRPNRERGL